MSVPRTKKDESPFKYTGNSYSLKFHRPRCPFSRIMSEHKRVRFHFRYQAVAEGYVPCRYCLPPVWTTVTAAIKCQDISNKTEDIEKSSQATDKNSQGADKNSLDIDKNSQGIDKNCPEIDKNPQNKKATDKSAEKRGIGSPIEAPLGTAAEPINICTP